MLAQQLKESLEYKKIIPEEDFGRSSSPKEGVIAKESAVCIFSYPLNGEPHFSLMLRNTYKGVHSNQISLPGGKREDSDQNLEETAIRECYEEIGAKPEFIIGQLPRIYIPPSNFNVTPFIGYSITTPDFKLDKREVHTHIQLPLNTLKKLTISISEIEIKPNLKISVPSFVYQKHIIWGATGHILSCMRQLL